MVIYGNTAEDLGQFNIDFDDSSLTDLVTSAEGKLEDLPLALHSINRTIEESISSLNVLSLPVAASDISIEVKQLLHLMLKVLELSGTESIVHKIISTVTLAASSYIACDLGDTSDQKHLALGRSKGCEDDLHRVIIKARKDLLELYGILQHDLGNISANLSGDSAFFETEADMASSKQLVDMLSQYFNFNGNSLSVGRHKLPQVIHINAMSTLIVFLNTYDLPLFSIYSMPTNLSFYLCLCHSLAGTLAHGSCSFMMSFFFNVQSKSVTLGLSIALFLCSGRDSCFHFVNSGGMDKLAYIFSHDMKNSTSIMLLLLGVIEQATRHSIGCEGYLGWWPREDENIPSGISEGYGQLLNLLLQKPRHDVASLATLVLHRLRLYEVASRYEVCF